MPGDTFHRFGDDYFAVEARGKSAPDLVKRVVLALGSEPLENAQHLLTPIPAPVSSAPQNAASTSNSLEQSTSFIVEVSGQYPLSLLAVLETLTPEARAALGFPRLWARVPGPDLGEPPWFPLPYFASDALPDADLPIGAVAFSWALSQLILQGRDAIRELDQHRREIEKRFSLLGWNSAPGEAPEAAVARAARLNRIKARFARPIEMRLMPPGRPFPSRQVWRTAYALGLTWGEMDLFHWEDPRSGHRIFTLSSLGQPGYFLPERAVEGEGIHGLSLGFELPTAPDPLETFDRMAIALGYLHRQLGGRPTASDGAELDAERLYGDRMSLEEAIGEMVKAGIAPGSAEAARYF
ncbi:MAG: cell division protein ZipA C-terminal FtsZ-binding domain-containing protein [Armatimonadota bacterium]